MNVFTYIVFIGIVLSLSIQGMLCWRQTRHVRHYRDKVPLAFSDKIPLKAHQKAADYTCTKAKFGFCELIFSMLLLLLWTLGGGLNLLDNVWRSLSLTELYTGTGVFISFFFITFILELPLAVYRTFVLEQRFGFNKSTIGIFFGDILKNILIALLIGSPLIIFTLWVMDHTAALWWLYVWGIWLSFSVLMMWCYPKFIAPLFNQFRPLENSALRTRIEKLLDENGFTSNGIFVMDGSTRSTHGNAYFTGLGNNKKIVFFDTLLDELSHSEIEAVLAHELGHFKCHHIRKRLIVMGTIFLLGFGLLGWLIDLPWFYQGLGVSVSSKYIALLLFVIVSPVFTFFLQPLFSYISRQHEFEADDFAADQGTGQAEQLISALVNLYRENANTLTPDPIYSAFYDSHPPAPIRIAHLATHTV